MPTRPTALLWDNDGVLVDTEGLYFQATREVLATVAVDLDEALCSRASASWPRRSEREPAKGRRLEDSQPQRDSSRGSIARFAAPPWICSS